jgi:3-hydroxypropanoate dehydrogenase
MELSMTATLTVEGFPTQLTSLDEAAVATLFTHARTVNAFADTPVSDEELAAIWELAKWAPTAANTQPLRVQFVRTPEGKERLLKHMAEGNAAKTAAAPATAVLAVDTRFHEHIPELLPFRPELKDTLEENQGMRAELGTFNAALQAGYFILAVRAHGLAAGPMAGFDKEGVNQEFFPDGRWKSTLVVNIGHPGQAPWFGRLPRLEADSVVSWA